MVLPAPIAANIESAILRDERDLLWLVIDDLRIRGADCLFDVHFLAREELREPPSPFLSGFGYHEPLLGLQALLQSIDQAVSGEVSALRHDPIADGLSIELRRADEADSFEVVLWIDLTRMNQAMKARANAGRHRGGLRFFTTGRQLADFRGQLFAIAFGGAERAEWP